MDDDKVLARAMTWMRKRNWREKLAKSKSGQSLYEHSLIELDVFLRLAPMLRDRKHYGFSDSEENILAVAILVHDAGKETEEWQKYVRSGGAAPWISHILPELSEILVPEICSALGLTNVSTEVHKIIVNCAAIHHDRPGQSDAAIISAMLSDASDRFLMLANLLKAIDHLCSAETPSEAVSVARTDSGLRKHLNVTAHELAPRGVSTTMLHRAAQKTFEQAGWTPLLYFAIGTLYAADLNLHSIPPSVEDIGTSLRAELEQALSRDITALIVGSPTGNILPKPDLLSFTETRKYLSDAGRKISPQSFAKKKLQDRRKVVSEYLKLRGRSDDLSDAEIELQSGRISAAQPEMLVFKFFKALMDPGKVPTLGEDGAKLAQQKYESVFGSGSWDQLQSTSTLMAARDMASTVDRYWELPGGAVGSTATSVEQLPNEVRLDTLVETLSNIADAVFEAISRPSPRDSLADNMATNFVADLLIPPSDSTNIKALAARQLENYRLSKPNAGKELDGAVYLCPVCNKPFDGDTGVKASADFIDNPGTHTNRGVSHGGFGYVMVCLTCYHERILRQLLMGQPMAEIIALSPRLNLGPSNGTRLLQKIREWADEANSGAGVESGFSMSFTDQTALKMRDRDPFELEPEELLGLFRYRFTSETQKKRKKIALDALREAFDDDIDSFNTATGESFGDFDSALEAVMEDRIDQQECKAIRREALKLGDVINLIPQTANLILIPLKYELASGKDESETNKALRRLFVTLILSLVFDASVSIRGADDVSVLGHGTGAAYVPPVPGLRSLVRKEWIDVADARYWLAAIGAASVLGRDAGLPSRSALYQALTTEPAEKLVRRIEEKGRTVSPLQLNLITKLPGFHNKQFHEVQQ